jgi:hypothetical protein
MSEHDQHFNFGYLSRLAENGVDHECLHKFADNWMDVAQSAGKMGLVTVPAVAGVLTALIHHHLTSPTERDVEDLKNQIYVDTLTRETDNIKRRTESRARQTGTLAG